MTLFDTADLDFQLSECGDVVVFAGPITTKGLLDREEMLGDDGNGFQLAGTRITLAVREGTQPAGLKEEDPVAVTDAITSVTTNYLVRDTGAVHADGLRRLTLVVA